MLLLRRSFTLQTLMPSRSGVSWTCSPGHCSGVCNSHLFCQPLLNQVRLPSAESPPGLCATVAGVRSV